MQSLLSQLRTILEHERALFGPLLVLPRSVEEGRLHDTEPSRPKQSEPAPHVPALDVEASPSKASEGDGIADKTHDMPDEGLFNTPATKQHRTPYERIHALIPPDSPLHGMAALAEVEAFVRDTVLIPLDETRTNPVFGVGNPEADLMVIGEAPGADEDAQGEPFVGRAGQLLDKILAAIGFSRDEIYIANILKSRPPNNRNPLAAEVEAHVPILYKQIALIQPKLLLCVGKTSASTLLDLQTSLGAMRERFHDFHGLPLLVTYHPAALLRNPQWKRPTWEDVQKLRRRYDELVKVAA